MGSACSNQAGHKADPAQIEQNRAIEKELMTERKKKVLKLLLLGPGESGKSTTLKQIRIIHDQGFSDDEKEHRKYIIYQNLLTGCVDLAKAMDEHRISYEMPETYDLSQNIMRYLEENKNNERVLLTETIADQIARFLMDPAVQKALYRTPEISIDDAGVYFMQNLDRVREPDYLPTTDDILKSRVPTTGVIQFSFIIKNFVFRVFDNRMRDSIELFSQICNNQWFADTAMILFLNKIDLFEEKIKVFPITVALPRYKGEMEYRPVLDYITKKFKQQNKNQKRTVYHHETCATDTSQIQVVIDSVIDVVIQQTMQKVGIQ
ncbi:unnamed protein product, partial [Mesorhabditis spiculigera]